MLYLGDCLNVMRQLPDGSVDAIVTDPPYGIAFMGKRWDYDVPSVEVWQECLRLLKPGGHLLAFAGTRTQHRMAVRIEDAGFEIRDMIAWVYGSGFPKSLDVSKAMDKAAGAEREIIGTYNARGYSEISPTNDGRNQWAAGNVVNKTGTITAPATDAARQWQGWGTALKPALEPITMARKPLVGTVADNVQQHGTGALNIDGCRVEGGERPLRIPGRVGGFADVGVSAGSKAAGDTNLGRWPANLIHDGSEEVVSLFPEAGGGYGKRGAARQMDGWGMGGNLEAVGYGDSGSAARFFYCAKTSKTDRGIGNNHPTVKPTDLMRYLCRLVTPPGGIVLDPFMGSGSTGKAAKLEGFQFIGIEREQEYFDIAQQRINNATPEQSQLDLLATAE